MNSTPDIIALIVNKILRAWRFGELRRAGASIGKSVQTYGPFFKGKPDALRLGHGVRIMRGALLSVGPLANRLSLADSVYINRNTMIDCCNDIIIGAGTLIGPNVYICDYDHGYLIGLNNERSIYGAIGAVDIGANVWLGAGVIITKNVTIGRNSIIGAGSVVTRSIPEDALALGNPARVVGKVSERFAIKSE